MVSFVTCGSCSESGAGGDARKRRRMDGDRLPAETFASAELQRTSRQRKQKLKSKLSDSGFEDDLDSSPAWTDRTPLRSETQSPVERVSSWYLQYGDVGYSIQREKEARFHPCSSLARQPQLTAEARCRLVSWLVPVHKHLRLSFECCCLAVNIVDRFLASTAVAADCFQLLGVTALLLASKQVEVCSPRISRLLALCCDAFTREQLCNLECLVLLRLGFCLAAPTLAFFLDYYANCIETALLVTENADNERIPIMNSRSQSQFQGQCVKLAQRVCELSLADYAFNKYPPSLTASCALTVARELLRAEQGPVDHARALWARSVAQPAESPEAFRRLHLQTLKGHVPPVDQERCDALAQECKDNLKLLVSLNQESLEVTATV
ncbi:cyclin-O [Betta splendens]|uniref:G2/mitotic-specific cyclin-B2 n=1 Tax=Betta splendens TaxID=158456 RepID=A0A6P7NHM4_BETSP|nr:cyclin-O [Betta splendens]